MVNKKINENKISKKSRKINFSDKKTEIFSEKELENIREKLIEMKEEIIKSIEDKQKYDLIENEVGDPIDDAEHNLNKEVLFELSDSERQNLDNIESSLRKIENKRYGICEQCGKPIDKKRLKVLPQSRYCIVCQARDEKYR